METPIELLQAAIERMQDEIESYSDPAPIGCSLSEEEQVKRSGRRYRYAYIVTRNGKRKQAHSLGRVNSKRHRDWKQRIAARDRCVHLQRQIRTVQGVIDSLSNSNFSPELF